MRDWLIKARHIRGYSQTVMAEKLGISIPYYSMIESGRKQKKMTLETASRLSDALNISIHDIIRQEVETRKT